ncbi:hypothetical protein [Flavobacterium reichenbachii]|uniref:Uncharacterized protein n=1 Tax=Flavobacterium reichenbachii TaxID=362418 RepID=A0A085ZJA8_9FLAO|nr:hypothetical protein [Flavobacterium reichenbachii]KFF04522.1 hypothetical protein IW19_02815 [Flavobacterium reichenbachii]OXB09298.1 hypothetical protein B0A68_24095 [Flavobacterium reichenbachii]
MIEIVENYENYINTLPELISKSYYKADFFIQKLGLKHATYYRKLKSNSFTHQEVKLITTLLFPEEILMQELQKSEEDIKAGRTINFEDFKQKLKIKYNI